MNQVKRVFVEINIILWCLLLCGACLGAGAFVAAWLIVSLAR